MLTSRMCGAGVVLLLLVACLSCGGDSDGPDGGASNGPPDVAWEQVRPLGSGGFPPGSQNTPLWEPGKFPLGLRPLVAFGGDLWMLAQTFAYSSSDGLDWKQHDKTDWGERIWEGHAFFDDKLWMFGGLDYDSRTFLNDIWTSSDGESWEEVGTAAWSPRKAQGMVEYQGKLWLFGSANHVDEKFGTDQFLNDVWSSEDGLNWTQVTASAPWSPRDEPMVVVYDDQLFMLGGQGHADVWRSTDGKDWTQVTEEAEWGVRSGQVAAVYDDRMWVLGGWIDDSRNAQNDVWFSEDGKTWTQQAEHAPWAPRSPPSVVFQHKLWLYSGKHTGADDSWGCDIWTLSAATDAARRR
jgi:hypothetical protein